MNVHMYFGGSVGTYVRTYNMRVVWCCWEILNRNGWCGVVWCCGCEMLDAVIPPYLDGVSYNRARPRPRHRLTLSSLTANFRSAFENERTQQLQHSTVTHPKMKFCRVVKLLYFPPNLHLKAFDWKISLWIVIMEKKIGKIFSLCLRKI